MRSPEADWPASNGLAADSVAERDNAREPSRLRFQKVTKSFAKNRVVDDISFELKPNEVLCLLGPSGCGKTTLLRLAAGIETPSSGRILMDDHVIAGPEYWTPPEARGIGMVFQDFALFPHLSNVENVAFGLRGLGRARARKAAMNALERVGLHDYARGYPHELSGGEQQRLALARALAPRPSVVLLDEPFSGLDQRLRTRMRRETLHLLKKIGATCILVTHDPEEAMWLADRIVLMRGGRLIQMGSPEDLFLRPVDAETARFFGEFNELRAVRHKNQIDTPVGRFRAPSHVPHEALVLLRPQGIFLSSRKRDSDFEAVATSVKFIGDGTLVRLAINGQDEPVFARLDGKVDLGSGESRTFGVLRDHLLFFARDGVA